MADDGYIGKQVTDKTSIGFIIAHGTLSKDFVYSIDYDAVVCGMLSTSFTRCFITSLRLTFESAFQQA